MTFRETTLPGVWLIEADVFADVEELAYEVAGKTPPQKVFSAPEVEIVPPRLTEDWFC